MPSKNLQRGRPCGAGSGGEASTPSQCCHLVVWLSSHTEWHGSLWTVDTCLCAAVCPVGPFWSWDRPGRLGIGYCFTAVTHSRQEFTRECHPGCPLQRGRHTRSRLCVGVL